MTKSGTILVTSDFEAKYTTFGISLLQTVIPDGTSFNFNLGEDGTAGKNNGIQKMTGDWVWFLNDKLSWQPDTLVNLLKHDADVIVPVVTNRTFPFNPMVYSKITDKGELEPLDILPLKTEDKVEVYAAASAGMLVKRSVFAHIAYPWFEEGKIGISTIGDDFNFCQKAKKAGFKIFCDLTVTMNQTMPINIGVERNDEGNWAIGLDFNGTKTYFPIAS